jgi:hypothetical protein
VLPEFDQLREEGAEGVSLDEEAVQRTVCIVDGATAARASLA